MRWPRRSTATTRPSSSGALPRAAGRGGPSKTSSWRPSAGSTGTTWPGCTATCATFPPPSTKQRSTMPYGSTSPWSKPNSPSLHHSQGGSTPPRHACTQQSSRPAAATSPTRSTTCSLSPGCSAACWTRALVTSTCRWEQRQAGTRRRAQAKRTQPILHRAQRLRPGRAASSGESGTALARHPTLTNSSQARSPTRGAPPSGHQRLV